MYTSQTLFCVFQEVLHHLQEQQEQQIMLHHQASVRAGVAAAQSSRCQFACAAGRNAPCNILPAVLPLAKTLLTNI
jgi:hypothetical protein